MSTKLMICMYYNIIIIIIIKNIYFCREQQWHQVHEGLSVVYFYKEKMSVI